MDKIDLDAILQQEYKLDGPIFSDRIKRCMKEAIRQTLVLVSENATYKAISIEPNKENIFTLINMKIIIDKQSILDIEKLIV